MLAMSTVMSGCSNGGQETASGTETAASQEEDTSTGEETQGKTLVVGVSALSGEFTPFYADSEGDREVMSYLFETPAALGADGQLTNLAGSIAAEKGETETVYTVTVKNGMKFWDGEEANIDDYLFSLYVMADPYYDGTLDCLDGVDIVGLEAYRFDTEDPESVKADLESRIAGAVEEIKEEEVIAWMRESALAGWWDNTLPGNADGQGLSWVDYIRSFGGEHADFSSEDVNEVFEKLLECEQNFYYEDYRNRYEEEVESRLTRETMEAALADGIAVTGISGIERTNDYTCRIRVNGYQEETICRLASVPIVASHYYGNAEAAPFLTKGNLESLQQKRGEVPMGTGPYEFKSYQNHVLTLTRNESYHQGTPASDTLICQETNEDERIGAVADGYLDIAKVQAEPAAFQEINTLGLRYSLAPEKDIWFMGVNADKVSDLNLRKALLYMTEKESIVSSYYGGLADVLDYPISSFSSLSPAVEEKHYAFSVENALAAFKEAGYEKNDEGRMEHQENGVLTVNIGIAYAQENPLRQMADSLKTVLEENGISCSIYEYSGAITWDSTTKSTLDLWMDRMDGMADGDLSRNFAVADNVFGLQDETLQEKMDQAYQAADEETRKSLTKEALDALMDKAVILPVCQAYDLIVYGQGVVLPDGLEEQTGAYWDFSDCIYQISPAKV